MQYQTSYQLPSMLWIQVDNVARASLNVTEQFGALELFSSAELSTDKRTHSENLLLSTYDGTWFRTSQGVVLRFM